VNERERLLLRIATDRLKPYGEKLRDDGWNPELIVFSPSEIERVPGYKVAIVVPIEPYRVAETPAVGSNQQLPQSAQG